MNCTNNIEDSLRVKFNTLQDVTDKSGIFTSVSNNNSKWGLEVGKLAMFVSELPVSFYRNELLVIARRVCQSSKYSQALDDAFNEIHHKLDQNGQRQTRLLHTDMQEKTGHLITNDIEPLIMGVVATALLNTIDNELAVSIFRDAALEYSEFKDLQSLIEDLLNGEQVILNVIKDIPIKEFTYIVGYPPQEYIRCDENVISYFRNAIDDMSISIRAIRKSRLLGVDVHKKISIETLLELTLLKKCIDASNIDIFKLSDELIQRIHNFDIITFTLAQLLEVDRVYRVITSQINFMSERKNCDNAARQMVELFNVMDKNPDTYDDLDYLIGVIGDKAVAEHISDLFTAIGYANSDIDTYSSTHKAYISNCMHSAEDSTATTSPCYTDTKLEIINGVFRQLPLRIVYYYILDDTSFRLFLDELMKSCKESVRYKQYKEFSLHNAYMLYADFSGRIIRGKDINDIVEKTLNSSRNWSSLHATLMKAKLVQAQPDITMEITSSAYMLWYKHELYKRFNTKKSDDVITTEIHKVITQELINTILESDLDKSISILDREIDYLYISNASEYRDSLPILKDLAISDISLGYMSLSEVEHLARQYKEQLDWQFNQ